MDLPATKNPQAFHPGKDALLSHDGALLRTRADMAAIGLIFLYCMLFAVLRLSVSPVMELDESEQFLNGFFFSLGYAHQAPLYSWIVHGTAFLGGMGLPMLVAVKYTILFSFYLSFYLIARSFWNTGQSLSATGSLLLFPTYSYEFNRDLSHTVLVTAMAAIASYFFLRLMRREKTGDYLLFGAAAGLGILSKYNFVFFLSALTLAAISFDDGRRVLFRKKMLLSLAMCLLVISPHVFWLAKNSFLPLQHSLVKAETGELPLASPRKVFSVIASSYSGVVPFFAVFALLFGLSALKDGGESRGPKRLFRYLSVYGLIMPVPLILILRAGHFSERWLAPLLFSLPLAFFSRTCEHRTGRVKLLGYAGIAIAVAIFAARTAVGFFPDSVRKVERIHTPFSAISKALAEELGKRGVTDRRDVTITAGSEFLIANMINCLPGAKFLSPGREEGTSDGTGPIVLVWDAGESGAAVPERLRREFPAAVPLGLFEARYLRSGTFSPYVLGAALVK